MKVDYRVLGNGSVGHNNDSPTYVIHNPTTKSTNKRSKVSCCEENDPILSILVDDFDKGSKSSDLKKRIRWNTKRGNYGLG